MFSPDLRHDLIDPGAMLASTHELPDGSRVRLRLARPTDLDRIESFLESAGTDERGRRFAFYDPRERLVLAATSPAGNGEEIAGLADVTFRDDRAAVDVLVDGDAGGRGLGALLAKAAASLARRRHGATHVSLGRNAA